MAAHPFCVIRFHTVSPKAARVLVLPPPCQYRVHQGELDAGGNSRKTGMVPQGKITKQQEEIGHNA